MGWNADWQLSLLQRSQTQFDDRPMIVLSAKAKSCTSSQDFGLFAPLPLLEPRKRARSNHALTNQA